MKSIRLTGKNGKGKFALISDRAYDECKKHAWKFRGKYPCTLIRGRFVYLHVLVKQMLEDVPEGMVVDHINGCTLCALDDNLRVVTTTENLKNKHKNVQCGFDHTKEMK
jgi:hypothetical protein